MSNDELAAAAIGKFCRSGINCRGCGTVWVLKNLDFVGFFDMAWRLLVNRRGSLAA
jgi:hypothetical protein